MRYRPFTFWLNLDWFLFIYKRFIYVPFMFNSSFWLALPSQVLKDFSVENLQTIPSIFLSKFLSQIYLSRIINYWCSIFTSYLRWGAFSLDCVLSAFFSFFLIFFNLLSVFSLTDSNDSKGIREHRGNNYFSCFLIPPTHGYSFSSSRFLPFLLDWSICKYKSDTWWDTFFLEICIL